MSTERDSRVAIVRPREEVQTQLAEAWKRLDEASKGETPGTLRELHGVDAEAFSALIEAMVQLGQPVDEEMQRLAGLKPVEEILGLS